MYQDMYQDQDQDQDQDMDLHLHLDMDLHLHLDMDLHLHLDQIHLKRKPLVAFHLRPLPGPQRHPLLVPRWLNQPQRVHRDQSQAQVQDQ